MKTSLKQILYKTHIGHDGEKSDITKKSIRFDKITNL